MSQNGNIKICNIKFNCPKYKLFNVDLTCCDGKCNNVEIKNCIIYEQIRKVENLIVHITNQINKAMDYKAKTDLKVF
jgi:hypothetical protein